MRERPSDLVGTDKLFRVLILGVSHVGKSSLIESACHNSDHQQSFASTIGVDFRQKCIRIGSENLKLQLWDAVGHENFRTLTSSYYSLADSVVLVFDISRPESFESVHSWANQLKKNVKPNLVCMLIGNKMDKKRLVGVDEALELARSHGMFYCETSAKTGENVQKAFSDIAAALLLANARRTEQKKRLDVQIPVRTEAADTTCRHRKSTYIICCKTCLCCCSSDE